jgi:hypothetical protein
MAGGLQESLQLCAAARVDRALAAPELARAAADLIRETAVVLVRAGGDLGGDDQGRDLGSLAVEAREDHPDADEGAEHGHEPGEP